MQPVPLVNRPVLSDLKLTFLEQQKATLPAPCGHQIDVFQGFPHPDCDDAVHGALHRHAGDGRSHDLQPFALLVFSL